MVTTQTQPNAQTSHQHERISWKRLWLTGLIVIVIATLVNALLNVLALSFLSISTKFMQLHGPVIPFTIAGSLGAVLAFALIVRLTRRPILLYRIIATVVLVLSLIPDLGLRSAPGASVSAIGTLMVMHTLTYLICVGLLTTVTRAK
jgi:hypothetical protein